MACLRTGNPSSQLQFKLDKSTQHLRLEKQARTHRKALRALSRRTFRCQKDAEQAVEDFSSSLSLYRLEDIAISSEKRYLKRGRPSANTPFEKLYYVCDR